EGAVDLVEIPTHHEINDNIVAFWRPKTPLQAKREYNFTYRLHWCSDAPASTPLARVVDSRSGLSWTQDTRLFVIDLAGEILKSVAADAALEAQVSTGQGKVKNPVAQPNPEI